MCIHTYIHTYIHTCIALHCIASHDITLHCIALHCIALHYITLHYITLHYTTLHYTTQRYTTLDHHIHSIHTYTHIHCITLHYITLHDITLHYIRLHHMTLQYMTLHYVDTFPGKILAQIQIIKLTFRCSRSCLRVVCAARRQPGSESRTVRSVRVCVSSVALHRPHKAETTRSAPALDSGMSTL